MNFFHISDLHFNPDDKNGIQNLEKILKSIAFYKKNDDILLVSGDILNKDFSDYQPVFDKLKKLDMPFLCCTGNHDCSAQLIAALKNLYPEHPLPLNKEKLDYVCNDFPLKIITLDSYKENVAGGEVLPSQLDFLEKEIENSIKPIIIMVHQFPLDAGLDFFDKKTGASWRQDFVRIIAKHTHKIKLVACGHLHNSVISHIEQTPVISAFSANWQADFDFMSLDSLKNVSRPVGYYIHRYDGEKMLSYAVAL